MSVYIPEIKEEVSENAKMLVEDNGKIVRIPMSEAARNEEEAAKALINDYISMTSIDSDMGYWYTSAYDSENAPEVGKTYDVTINGATFACTCTGDEERQSLVNTVFTIVYNTDNKYLIDYKPSEDLGSNPTVDFVICENIPAKSFYIPITGIPSSKTQEMLNCILNGGTVFGVYKYEHYYNEYYTIEPVKFGAFEYEDMGNVSYRYMYEFGETSNDGYLTKEQYEKYKKMIGLK